MFSMIYVGATVPDVGATVVLSPLGQILTQGLVSATGFASVSPYAALPLRLPRAIL